MASGTQQGAPTERTAVSVQPQPGPPTLRGQLYLLSDLLASPHADVRAVREAAQEALALYQQDRKEHGMVSLLLRNLLSDAARGRDALDRSYYARQITSAVDRL
jgi:hypothetical protein